MLLLGSTTHLQKIIQLISEIMNFRQLDNENAALAWERIKTLVKNCPTHYYRIAYGLQHISDGQNYARH